MTDAIENLRDNQRQLDCDGVEVGVSRQALCELLDAIAELRVERDKARALVAALCDVAVYSDSYGVPGSDFACCRFCNAGGAPGVEFKHDARCPVGNAEATAEEWHADFHALEEQNERLRAALEAVKPHVHTLNWNSEGEYESLERQVAAALTEDE